MTEPTYHFVKGKGWIPFSEGLTTVYVNRPEIQFRLELRDPKPGERYGVFRSYSTNSETGELYVKGDTLDITLFARHLESIKPVVFGLDNWGVWSENYTRETNSYYCTFVMENE